jgi:hypothetical protein
LFVKYRLGRLRVETVEQLCSPVPLCRWRFECCDVNILIVVVFACWRLCSWHLKLCEGTVNFLNVLVMWCLMLK